MTALFKVSGASIFNDSYVRKIHLPDEFYGDRHIHLRFLFLEKVDFYSPIPIHREFDQCVSLWTYSSSLILQRGELDHGDEPFFLGEYARRLRYYSLTRSNYIMEMSHIPTLT